MDTPLVVPIAAAETMVPEVGGKAANLSRLVKLGAAVPEGFVITGAALRLFIDANGLQPLIDAACGDLRTKTPLGLRCAAETIAALFSSEPMPDPIRAAVLDAWRPLSTSRAIVRSSAAGEDSEVASFAGQLDSIAGVRDEAQLWPAIRSVWASRWGQRALAYQVSRDRPLSGMGVVVQRQVDASISGVLFTVAPGSSTRMLLEYCGGMGEALVSGAVNPGRVSLGRSDLSWRLEAPPDTPPPDEHLLFAGGRLPALAALGLRIEEALERPQDIEWTMDAQGRTWIVQSRPITVLLPDPDRRTQAAASVPAPAAVLWSNANVNENFPGPISPLLYSVARAGYYHYFRNLGRAFGISTRRLARMEQPLRRIIGVHGARMYYNLTSIHAVLRSAPFGEGLASAFNQFTGAGEIAPADPHASFAARAGSRARRWAELATIAAKTTWQYAFLTRRVERFERTVSGFAERTRPDALRDRPLQDLLDDLHGFMDIRCNRWNDAALADAGSMVCYGVLQRLLARAFPDEDQQALHNTLLKALPDLVSGRPALALWDLSREIRSDAALRALFGAAPPADVLAALAREPRFATFHAGLRQYLEEWGFRCSAELMLTVPSFQEQPEPVVELLKSYAALDAPSPTERLKQQESERLAETARVRRALKGRRLFARVPLVTIGPIVSLVLGWTQTSIQLRERARLKQALLYSRLRHVARAIGARLLEAGRLESQDDVFFLTFDEIDALASGHAMFPDAVRPLVALRREAHARLSAMSPPDSMRLAPGEYLEPVPARQTAAASAVASDSLPGVGACGGSRTGRAAILADVTEADRIRRGDVLVTRQTDPGWGPIFPLISGLVIERGGMLSHGAIIAREFGIPSVVGVRDATRLIRHGSLITVDGDRGIVRLEGEAAPC